MEGAVPLLRGLRGNLLLSLALAGAVVAVLALYGDAAHLGRAFQRFPWLFLPPILGLTLLNYLLRFVKWHYYLGQIGVTGLDRRTSLLVFFAGLAMVLTPGKVGEWVKAYLVRETTGKPFSATAPIIVAERLSDGLAMLLLASVGLWVYGYGRPVAMAVLLGAAGVILLSRWRALAGRVLALVQRLPALASQVNALRAFYESSYRLFGLRNLLVAVGLGLVSWFGECLAFYLVLVGLGLPGTPLLLMQATFILAAATLIGAVSMLPGGLAAAEGSIAGLLLLLPGMHVSPTTAAAATILIRACTLWFGVAVGAVALLVMARRLAAAGGAGHAGLQAVPPRKTS